MIFEFLRTVVAFVFVFDGLCPDAAGYAADHGVLRVHTIAEKERKIRREVIDVHPAAQIVLHECETIRKRECEL